MEIGFNRASLGYNPEEVDQVIDKFLTEGKEKDLQIEEFKTKYNELQARFEALEKQQNADRTHIANTMIAARQDAVKILEQAKNDADSAANEASGRAETIIAQAHQEAKRIISEAGKVADDIHNRTINDFAQTEAVVLKLAEASRKAKAELTGMFESTESGLMQMLENIRQMLPEPAAATAENPSGNAAQAEPGKQFFAAIAALASD